MHGRKKSYFGKQQKPRYQLHQCRFDNLVRVDLILHYIKTQTPSTLILVWLQRVQTSMEYHESKYTVTNFRIYLRNTLTFTSIPSSLSLHPVRAVDPPHLRVAAAAVRARDARPGSSGGSSRIDGQNIPSPQLTIGILWENHGKSLGYIWILIREPFLPQNM